MVSLGTYLVTNLDIVKFEDDGSFELDSWNILPNWGLRQYQAISCTLFTTMQCHLFISVRDIALHAARPSASVEYAVSSADERRTAACTTNPRDLFFCTQSPASASSTRNSNCCQFFIHHFINKLVTLFFVFGNHFIYFYMTKLCLDCNSICVNIRHCNCATDMSTRHIA